MFLIQVINSNNHTSQSSSSVNTGNHLLALQMLVDGNTTELDSPKQLCANYKPFQSKNNQQESQTLKKKTESCSH